MRQGIQDVTTGNEGDLDHVIKNGMVQQYFQVQYNLLQTSVLIKHKPAGPEIDYFTGSLIEKFQTASNSVGSIVLILYYTLCIDWFYLETILGDQKYIFKRVSFTQGIL